MSFLLVLLLLLVQAHSYATAQVVVLAQAGKPVTIPRKPWGKTENIHVNWEFNDTILISRNPTASSQKDVPLNWQGRISLTTDFSLHISNVTAIDFGIFKCDQHELVNSISDTYKLYQVTMSTLAVLLSGDDLSLSCEINREGFNLVRPTVRWLGPDDKTYQGQSTENKYTLKVPKISSIHHGNWICEVQYGVNSLLNAMTNVVIVDLAPSSPDPIYAADSSSNFALPCSFSSKISWSLVNATGVKGGSWSFISADSSKSISPLLKLHPNPSPVWKIPNGTSSYLMESEVKNQDLSVKISKVSIMHRGQFTCSLDLKKKSLSQSVLVEVLQVISSAGKPIYEGSKLNLTCTLGHPMPPDLEVTWKAPTGSSLPNLSPHPTELSIPGVRLKDSGQWACELKKNATVLATATIRLKIEKAPVNTWLVVGIFVGLLVLILLAVIAVIIICRRRKVMKYTRRKRKFCCCKNPQPKGFYKT
ncbi:CD4-1 molecule isoform X2 [Hemibagrus wyckioides]|uniref:CD4-1 molecule isoform X2 n=1 Tax=Hemibagrus wyckioides TaxID=337641 RepID=UPI00266CAEF3|nr:CD4-1 molecule isoform X2 [Hemibagrus wyckioides]